MYTTRFAPSPTGPLHLGHAFSALIAWDRARAAGGQFLLRLEDIDRSRARAEWEDLIFADLGWLGLSWPVPPMRQSARQDAYDAALDRLWDMGVLYPCRCTRRDIAAALDAPQEGAPLDGPDGLVYPGTCRPPVPPRGARPADVALRLDMRRATARIGRGTLTCAESGPGDHGGSLRFSPAWLVGRAGDIVLSRRGIGTSYHLAVTVDDAAQRITEVVRGADLREATGLHLLLQGLLDLPTPRYHHHRLIRDDAGKRLAKRDDARALRLFRDEGLSPTALRARLSLPPAS